MNEGRASGGLLLSALGAAVLAVATFQPWYEITITPAGAAAAQQQLSTAAQQYGNSAMQTLANQIGAGFNSVAGRPLASVSAHQSLKHVSLVLLILAGASLLVALLRLAGMLDTGNGWIAIFGLLAALCVLYRMFSPPNPAAGLMSLSLVWGSWLALIGASAIVVGGAWSPSAGARQGSAAISPRA